MGLAPKAPAVLRVMELWGLQQVAEPDLLADQLHADRRAELEALFNARAEP